MAAMHVDDALKAIGELQEQKRELLAALKHAERFCPCGARPESPNTHPHVGGCPIGDAIAKAEATQ